MNYQKVYDSLIERAKARGLDKKKLEGYFEKHHIIPRCIGGLDEDSNYVLLTGREHYLCHWLLWKTDRENKSLMFSYNMICNRIIDLKISSKQYEIRKIEFSNNISRSMCGNANSTGCIRSNAFKDKCRASKIGELNHMFGRIVSEDVRKKISMNSIGMRGKKHSDETKLKMSINRIKIDPCSIDGTIYSSSMEASKILNINVIKIRRYILSKTEKRKNYFYI